MGMDKARLPMGSHLLIEEVAGKIASAAGNVTLIGPPERYADLPLPCLPDLRPGFGPISGIETALASGRGELNLIVACDMPGLEVAWLRELVEHAKCANARCLVANDADGRVHPLCAVYKSSCLSVVSRAIDDQRLKMMDLISELQARFFEIKKLIHNVNRPEEWVSWQEENSFSFDGIKSV
jgi:molybdopterin-guanine dinucleotide biosynthesis protein A